MLLVIELLVFLKIFGMPNITADAKTLTLHEKKICSVNHLDQLSNVNSFENAFSGFRMEREFVTKESRPPLHFLSGLILCDNGEINYQKFNKLESKSKTDFMWDKTYCIKLDSQHSGSKKSVKKGFNEDLNSPKLNIKNFENFKKGKYKQLVNLNQYKINENYQRINENDDQDKPENKNKNMNGNMHSRSKNIKDNKNINSKMQTESENGDELVKKKKTNGIGLNQFLKSFKIKKTDGRAVRDLDGNKALGRINEEKSKNYLDLRKFIKINDQDKFLGKTKTRNEYKSYRENELDWGDLSNHRNKLIMAQKENDRFARKTKNVFLNKREAGKNKIGKQTKYHGFKENNQENDLGTDYDDFACYKFSRRKHLSKRKILILDKNQWVGGIFRCPMTHEFHRLLKQYGNRNTGKYLQPFDLLCNEATAIPIAPLFSEDLREQWIQDEDEYQMKRVPFLFSPEVIMDKQNRVDLSEDINTLQNFRDQELEVPNNWEILLNVNEDYIFSEKELQIMKNAILATIDYYKYIEDKEKLNFPWNQEDALQNNKAAQELNTLLQFTGLSHRIISILGNIGSRAATRYLDHIQGIWDDVAEMIE